MLATFHRTGHRRYRIEVQRPPFAAVEMDPAPGYDDLMPHDMMHLVVESQLGIERGIFGQLAAGGGTFRVIPEPSKSARDVARQRRRVSQRGKKMMRTGRDDCAQSEAAVYFCGHEWRTRSESNRSSERSALPNLSEDKLEQIFHHLDELSLYWSRLNVGDSMTIQWPDLSVSPVVDH